LWDKVFFAAPGRWTLWRCDLCRSAFLDPRPNRDTIGLAYSRYYTHATTEQPAPATAFQRLRSALGNGYRNARYGTRVKPALALGRTIGALVPRFAGAVDIVFRYLPRRPSSLPGRLLDIGCGNGDFLAVARSAGWEAHGSDPDAAAQAAARRRGFDVRLGGAEAWTDEQGTFDAVTLNHVLEHVHDPLKTLRDAFLLLRAGGQLYIETPNIDAAGHEIYGMNWRGLEPPRHLVLFNHDSLGGALAQTGFANIRFRSRPSPLPYLGLLSARMAAGLDPNDDTTPLPAAAQAALPKRLRERPRPGRSEFLTVTCERPS
jgi:SAM-dependent methyltransferase